MNKRVKMAVILGGLCGMAPICSDLYVPGFPLIADSFGVSPTEVQLSMTACLLGIAAGQFFIGPSSDVYGRKKPLLLSLLAFVLTSLGCALVADIKVFIALRFIQGMAGAGSIVLSRTIAYDVFRGQELTEFIALIMMINGVAPIAAPILGGQIITYLNWQAIFYFLMLCGIVMFAAVSVGLAESLPPEKRTVGRIGVILRSFGELLQNKGYAACLVMHCLSLGTLFTYISGSPFILQGLYGLSAEHYSWSFAVNGLGMMISARVASSLIHRMNELRQMQLALGVTLGSAVLIFALAFTDMLPLKLLLLLLLAISMANSVNLTNSFSLAMQNIRGNAGSASGLLGIGSFMLGALVTPLVGLAGEAQMTLMLGFLMMLTSGGSLLASALVPRPRR